jgi:2-oxoglutarate dehydrogenase E2 component (dihydrolipoamide succinyltransferase)
MPVALKVPFVGESINEVEIGEWLKQEGAMVAANDPVVVIETEKASLEVPAPVSGKVTQVLKKSGEKAAVGDVIGYMEQDSAPAWKKESPVEKPPELAVTGEAPKAEKQEVQPAPEPPKPAAPAPERQPEPTASAPDPPPKPTAPAPVQPSPTTERKESVVPMTPIRRRIAERLVEAQKNAALLTTFNEIDMSSIVALRTAYKEAFQQKHGVKLGIVSFFIKAVIEALKPIPQLNAEIRGENIVYRNFYDIGIAIGGGKGLVVPVLRDAERLSLSEIEEAIADFAARARDNRLKVEELKGGTFTITNGGIYGSLMSTPIINPPQSGVLGLHAITDRPVVRNGQIVARPMMYVALTYDHRIVDGREAVTFLKHVKDLIEEPALLLLGL